jgi:cytosine/adenosine deaminase-related metal-dependent hydrolase
MIVIPGMVDTHRHAWEGQLRRINPNSSTMEDYCNATHFSYGTAYRPFDIYVGNLITALGASILNNNDHRQFHNFELMRTGWAIQALVEVGIRDHAPGAQCQGNGTKRDGRDTG